MLHRIQFDDNCEIFYTTFDVHLRTYNFKYTTFHGIKHECNYEIYLVNIDGDNRFKVKSFMEDNVFFNTFDGAENYVISTFTGLKNKLKEEEEEIQRYLQKKDKRKRGSKKST